jgi:hypothetical protein
MNAIIQLGGKVRQASGKVAEVKKQAALDEVLFQEEKRSFDFSFGLCSSDLAGSGHDPIVLAEFLKPGIPPEVGGAEAFDENPGVIHQDFPGHPAEMGKATLQGLEGRLLRLKKRRPVELPP